MLLENAAFITAAKEEFLAEVAYGHLSKFKFRCNTVLLKKNLSLYIMYILRQNFSFAPCLA